MGYHHPQFDNTEYFEALAARGHRLLTPEEFHARTTTAHTR